MLVFAWWSDLAEFWSDLFDNPLHSAFALIVCVTAVLISIVLVLRFRPVGVRKLAWRVLLASVGFYVVIFGPWSSGVLRSDSWTEFLIVFALGVLLLLVFSLRTTGASLFCWHGHTKMSAGTAGMSGALGWASAHGPRGCSSTSVRDISPGAISSGSLCLRPSLVALSGKQYFV